MRHDPDANAAPAPSPASHDPAGASEESVVRAPTLHRGDDEEDVRDVDPHPDTPDDFDDDASSRRESIEAVDHGPAQADDD